MKISGFTIVKNATKLYYPVKESIESILPIVDEFVVVLGDCDADDFTLQEIERIQSDKIRVIHTHWDLEKYPKGTVYAYQTDIAKQACTGDWLFYIQSDEVIHEKYLPLIKHRCEELLHDKDVEGLLFKYRHFWGDYDHFLVSHAWYPREIRIVRNDPDIHSWRDAQSFRRIPDFNGENYRQKDGTFKLKVAAVNAFVYHYGWVRPPRYMHQKRKIFSVSYRGEAATETMLEGQGEVFDYGDLSKLSRHTGSHPEVMKPWVDRFNWQHLLFPNKPINKTIRHKHNKLKYRILTFIEQKFLGGRLIGGFKNYKLLKYK